MRLAIILGLLAACDSGPSVGPRSKFTAADALTARQACTFKAGTLPGLSLAKDAPLGSEIPIDTFVIIIMENRSFDHLLGDFDSMQPDADVAAPDAINPDTDGTPITRFHFSDMCFDDPNHGWNETHGEWDNGMMDGFVKFNYFNNGAPADGHRAMGYYTHDDLPFLFGAASTFAVADRSFSSVLGATGANRSYLQAASSFGLPDLTLFSDHHDNLIELMENGKVTWADYYSTLPTLGTFLDSISAHLDNAIKIEHFFDDVKAGKLSQVNFVDPQLGNDFGAVRTDLHPPGDPQLGDQWLEQVVKALIGSPQWPHMAIIITVDEHGGLYDHVAPPPACPPDDLEPMLGPNDMPGKFDRLGIRIPTILISPYAKPHHVSHEVYDHTSIARLLESRFILPAMTARDANANPLFDLFDFQHAALLNPPSLPSANVDAAKEADCDARYPSPTPAPGP